MKQDALTGAADRQPLVSVIMPAYNAEKYIGEAIASVCAQTYENWELLILDDGSGDRTAEIAQAYAQLDARIRVLRNPQNMGAAKTRNRGFDIAKGEWIALLDSDDVWHSDKLEKQLAVAGRAGVDIIYCSYALVNESGAHLSDYIVPETTSYDAMLRESVLSCSTVLLRQLILFPIACTAIITAQTAQYTALTCGIFQESSPRKCFLCFLSTWSGGV